MLGANRVDLEHDQHNLIGIAEFLVLADREAGTTMGLRLSESGTEEERRQQAEALTDDPE